MTKFNSENKTTLTYGECLHPAMKITDQADATQYLNDYVAFVMTTGKSKSEAESICKQNLGYFAGYYDNETMARINKLFCTTHPIFGS